MSIRVKRISIEAFEKGVAEAVGEPTANVDWHGNAVFVRKHLALLPMMEFVAEVVGNCFDDDTGEYRPELRDFAIRRAVLTKYANFSLPKDVEHCYELVIGCDVYNAILNIIDEAQFREMLKAVDDKIAHRASEIIEASKARNDELYAKLSELESSLGAIFNGVDAATIRALTSAMSDGRFSPEAIVKAYMSQKEDGDKVDSIKEEAAAAIE